MLWVDVTRWHMQMGVSQLPEHDFTAAGDRNYPWKTRTESTYDIALPDETDSSQYLSMLHEWIPGLFHRHAPQLVFFQAGVDALRGDSFGRCAACSCI